MTAITLSTRELAFREGDGIQVTLLWHSLTNRLSVLLRDDSTETCLDFGVAPADALDAFYHPFAYAVRSGGR
jgi:hypothetical protein